MTEVILNETKIVIDILREFGSVFVVSRDSRIVESWPAKNESQEGGNNHVPPDDLDKIIEDCNKSIKQAFDTQQSTFCECTVTRNNIALTYRLKALPVHPDKELIIVVAERLFTAESSYALPGVSDRDEAPKSYHKETYDFYEQIFNNIPAEIAVFNPAYTCLFSNKQVLKSEELRQWVIDRTNGVQSNSGAPETGNNADLNETEWIEKVVNINGIVEHHLRMVRPVYGNGKLELFLAYGLNITDLIKTQEELKSSMETFSSTFEYSGVGMALVSPFGHWLDMNSVVNKLIGYTKDELLGLTFQDVTYPDDIEGDVALLKQMLKKEISTYTIEKRYISKENKIIWISLTVSMVWNADQTPKFFIAQIIDICNKKQLEYDITQRNTELETTKNSLVNKVKQLEELSYIIAHNLRGAAGNIKAISGALVAKNKGGKFAEENPLSDAFTQEEAMEFIEGSSNSLMDSLATLMKITEIKLNTRIPSTICNPETIINDITEQLNNIIFEKKAIIITDLQSTQISYPKAYLENILYNLISNALKYTKSGISPQITIVTRVVNDRTQIVVKDNGLGIDMHKYGHLVFKLNNMFHKGFDSKGVGLYITKTQIESLGGTIELISRENEGCEFIVTL